MLHEPMYDMQDILKQNKDKLGDKVVVAKLLSQIDKVTSLKQHLRTHADFYRR